MRVNVYAEELTFSTEIVAKKADTGRTFVGARMFLESSSFLHHTSQDDDRSAVTFWINSIDSKKKLIASLLQLVDEISAIPSESLERR